MHHTRAAAVVLGHIGHADDGLAGGVRRLGADGDVGESGQVAALSTRRQSCSQGPKAVGAATARAVKRGVAAERSAQRDTSGVATGGGGPQAPPTRTSSLPGWLILCFQATERGRRAA